MAIALLEASHGIGGDRDVRHRIGAKSTGIRIRRRQLAPQRLLHLVVADEISPLSGEEPRYYLIIGEVVGVHIDDGFIVEGLVDTAAMRPITRAGYRDYFVATPETRFSMTRPKGG